MYKLIFCFAALFISQVVYSNDISFVIVSATNNEVISYASVGIMGTSLGTMSNDEGEVIIHVANNDDSLSISHISYQSQIISIKEANSLDTIFLDEIAIEIEEVTIKGDAGITILMDVINQLDKNHRRSDVLYKIYYHAIENKGEYYQKLDILAEAVVAQNGQFHFGIRKQLVKNNSSEKEDVFITQRPTVLKFGFKYIHDIFNQGACYADVNFLRKRNIKKFDVNIIRKYIDKVKGPIVELELVNIKSNDKHLLVVNQEDFGIYSLIYNSKIAQYYKKINNEYYLQQVDWALGGMTKIYVYEVQQGVKGMYFENNLKLGVEEVDKYVLEEDEKVWAPFRHLIK